jgi:hypothetical protein
MHSPTPWSRVPPEKLTGPQLIKKYLHFMAPLGSLLHSQEPATCPYLEADAPPPPTPHLEDPL